MSIPLVTLLGRMTLAFLEAIGSVSAFALQAVRCALRPPWHLPWPQRAAPTSKRPRAAASRKPG